MGHEKVKGVNKLIEYLSLALAIINWLLVSVRNFPEIPKSRKSSAGTDKGEGKDSVKDGRPTKAGN